MHEIVYLVSPPRSGSSAFMRMVEERGDLAVVHEPAVPAHDRVRYGEELASDWYRDSAPRTFAEVVALVADLARTRPVFVKEMSFALAAMLEAEPAFLDLIAPRATFLLRSPHATVISLYGRLTQETGRLPMDAAEFRYLAGFDAVLAIWRQVAARGSRPTLIRAEELAADPASVVAGFCRGVGLEFDPTALTWSPKSAAQAAASWTDGKSVEQVEHWHGAALASSGFGSGPTYEVDGDGNPTFAEVADPAGREICAATFAAAVPCFEEMTAGSASPAG